MSSDEELIDEVIDIFQRHMESFGSPEIEDLDTQSRFECAFCDWICKVKGHQLLPDHCLKPEHDYCCRCNRLATTLGYERDGHGGYRKVDE